MWHAFGMPWGGCERGCPSPARGSGGPPPENLKSCMLFGAIWHILGLIFSALTFAIFCFHTWYHVKLSAGKTLLLKKSLIQGMAELENKQVQFNPWIRRQLSIVQALAQLSLLLSVVSSLLLLLLLSQNRMWVPSSYCWHNFHIICYTICFAISLIYFSFENNVKLFQFGSCHTSSLCCNQWFG